MKNTGLLLIGMLFGTIAWSQDYKMGLGVRISSADAAVNNSVSLKYFFREKTALETLFSFGDPFALGVLVEQHRALTSNGLNWMFGGGAYFGFKGTRRAGLQGILGMDYKIPTLPLNFSLDWKPELNLSREFSFEPAAVALSARFTIR